MTFTISKGFEDSERGQVATLYWEAFAQKLQFPMGPRDKALTFIANELHPDFALIARNGAGVIIGVAGFKTAEGALIGGDMAALARVYGWLSACWRGPLLSLMERGVSEDILLMDGICVDPSARGAGVGTMLLQSIMEEAKAQQLHAVRLDVIDTNPRARALYERRGFVAAATEDLGPLRWIFGFSQSTTMICRFTT